MNFKIQMDRTFRGFARGDFVDLYGKECSIQKSSLATQDDIWLGCNEGTHHHLTGECCARMHLTREMASELIHHLQRFVETGELEDRKKVRFFETNISHAVKTLRAWFGRAN